LPKRGLLGVRAVRIVPLIALAGILTVIILAGSVVAATTVTYQFCPRCGIANGMENRFCTNCGTPIGGPLR